MKKKVQLPLVLRLLYNLSAELKPRQAISETDAPLLVRKQVLNCPEVQLPAELAAFAINLASTQKGATVMTEGGRVLQQLMERVFQTHDVLLVKLLRSLAQHEVAAQQLLQFLPDLIALAEQVDTPDLLVELLGTVAALPLEVSFGRWPFTDPALTHSRGTVDLITQVVPELPDLLQTYSFVEFLSRHLVPGFTDDDVLLEVIVLVGVLARNHVCAVLISNSRVVSSLYSLITEKQEDDEIVLQILYAFFQLMQA